jgi:hypothetical protein
MLIGAALTLTLAPCLEASHRREHGSLHLAAGACKVKLAF